MLTSRIRPGLRQDVHLSPALRECLRDFYHTDERLSLVDFLCGAALEKSGILDIGRRYDLSVEEARAIVKVDAEIADYHSTAAFLDDYAEQLSRDLEGIHQESPETLPLSRNAYLSHRPSSPYRPYERRKANLGDIQRQGHLLSLPSHHKTDLGDKVTLHIAASPLPNIPLVFTEFRFSLPRAGSFSQRQVRGYDTAHEALLAIEEVLDKVA